MKANYVMVQKEPWQKGYALYLANISGKGELFQISEAKFVEVKEGGMLPSPTMLLGEKEGQRLMDQLWDCGIRPSEGSGSAGAMAATQKHLEDMRSLVFKKEPGA